jgi:hypothetical protein
MAATPPAAVRASSRVLARNSSRSRHLSFLIGVMRSIETQNDPRLRFNCAQQVSPAPAPIGQNAHRQFVAAHLRHSAPIYSQWSHPRMLNEIPRFAAITVVAPGERFNFLAMLLTPALAFAIPFNMRMSSLVQRRITFFFFLANFGSFFVNRASITHQNRFATRRA